MASLQLNTMTGENLSGALHEAAIVAAQRGGRLCDITLDLTTGVLTVTENGQDQGVKVKRH